MGEPGLPEAEGLDQEVQGVTPGLLPPGPVPFRGRGRQSLLYSLGYNSNITEALTVAFPLGALTTFPNVHFPHYPQNMACPLTQRFMETPYTSMPFFWQSWKEKCSENEDFPSSGNSACA